MVDAQTAGRGSGARLSDFAIIGAARCGTASLHAYLRQHLEVFMSAEKETGFFSLGELTLDAVPSRASAYRARTRADYEHFFRDAGAARAVGEASPTALFYSRSAARMQQAIPDATVICILRDPVERASSHVALARKVGFEAVAARVEQLVGGREHEGRATEERLQLGAAAAHPLDHRRLQGARVVAGGHAALRARARAKRPAHLRRAARLRCWRSYRMRRLIQRCAGDGARPGVLRQLAGFPPYSRRS